MALTEQENSYCAAGAQAIYAHDMRLLEEALAKVLHEQGKSIRIKSTAKTFEAKVREIADASFKGEKARREWLNRNPYFQNGVAFVQDYFKSHPRQLTDILRDAEADSE